MSQPDELLDFALPLAELAAAQILPHFCTELLVENKQHGRSYDPVRVADGPRERPSVWRLKNAGPGRSPIFLIGSSTCPLRRPA